MVWIEAIGIESCCVSVQRLHPTEEHLKDKYVTTPREVCPSLKAPPELRHSICSHSGHFPGCKSHDLMGCDTLIIISPLPIHNMCHPLHPVQCFVTPTVVFISLTTPDRQKLNTCGSSELRWSDINIYMITEKQTWSSIFVLYIEKFTHDSEIDSTFNMCTPRPDRLKYEALPS